MIKKQIMENLILTANKKITLFKNKKSKDKFFRDVYDKYSEAIYAYCRIITTDHDEADEIFQQTFIRFYNNINPKKVWDNAMSYLIKTAKNLSLNSKRDKKNNVAVEKAEGIRNSRINYESKELMEIIIASLDLLKDDYKEIFIMRELKGLSYQEIAERLDITYENAKMRFIRSKKCLIKILDPYIKDLNK